MDVVGHRDLMDALDPLVPPVPRDLMDLQDPKGKQAPRETKDHLEQVVLVEDLHTHVGGASPVHQQQIQSTPVSLEVPGTPTVEVEPTTNVYLRIQNTSRPSHTELGYRHTLACTVQSINILSKALTILTYLVLCATCPLGQPSS